MGKELIEEEQAPVRQLSHDSSQEEAYQQPDLEKDAATQDLSRVVSGPPYTIFSHRTKLFIVAAVSISSLISPFGATTFYPALNVLAADLHIAQAIAPSIIAGMSDASGRRLSFIVCFFIYTAANIGLALQTSYAALLVLRMVQASGCSAAIALANAVVADIATSDERGRYMGYATAGLLIGPSFGPTIGGVLSQYLGWRSIFWFLVIFTAILLVVFVFFFPETCRNVVGNGSIPAKGVNLSILGYLQQRRHARETEPLADSQSFVLAKKQKFNFPNPLATLKILGEKESCMVLLYNGFFFTGMMVVTASLPDLFKKTYNLDELHIGLCYIALGMGSFAASLSMGHVVDWNFRRHARRLKFEIRKGKQQDLSDFPIEIVRFQVVIPGHIIGTLAILTYGWTVKFGTYIAAPEIALFFIGFGVSTSFNLTNTLLIDLHRDKPATATAAVNFVRCLLSAGGAAAIIPLCHAINPGWAFTLISMIYVVYLGMVFLIMKYGQQWRAEAAEKKKRQVEAAAAVAAVDVESQSNIDTQSIHEAHEKQDKESQTGTTTQP